MRTLLALVALLAVTSCTDPIGPLPRNECTQSFECGEDRCHPELHVCVRRESAIQPYSVVLQVAPSTAAPGAFAETGSAPQLLDRELSLDAIVVRPAITVIGQVRTPNSERGLEAELIFSSMRQRRPLSVVTARMADDRVGFAATLEPNTTYEVLVRPLGRDAKEWPPQTFPFETATERVQPAPFMYDTMTSFAGVLQDRQGQLQSDRKVLLRNKRTGSIASSLTRTGLDGTFELKVAPAVLENMAEYELQVGLSDRQDEWRVTITVDGSRLFNGGTITVPALPRPVEFIGLVEARSGTPGSGISATVTFSSSFQVPFGQPASAGVDWCLSPGIREPVPRFTCTSSVTVPVDPDGRVRASLYPGYYDIYVTPSATASDRSRLATTAPFDASIPIASTQDSGTFEGTRLELGPARVWPGVVSGEGDERLRSVRVTASALGLWLRNELPEIARYNRSAEALSDPDGKFELAVDTGHYDFIATPPEGSNFPSFCEPNRQVVAADSVDAGRLGVHIRAPVVVRGNLVTDRGVAVREARVDAFAIVPDLRRADLTRTLRIGSAVSTDAGTFVLYLPPQIGEDSPLGPLSLDGGLLDAGVP